jgi:hypothetical protein
VHLLAMTARTTGWLAQSTRRRARSEP